MPKVIDPLTRYVENADGCWLWTGPVNTKGYGQQGRRIAHRILYESHVGPVPEGKQLDHLCRVRSCVNPEHLEPVTARENTVRGWVARDGKRKPPVLRPTCKQGHLLAGDNVRLRSDNTRVCRACERGWVASYKRRQRAPVVA